MRIGTVAIIATLVIATAIVSSPAAVAGDPQPLIAPVCPADLNADSIVDRADLARLLRFYGACLECEEDLNRDNFVDSDDVAILTGQWGPCPPEGDYFGGDHSKGSLVEESDPRTEDSDSFAEYSDSLTGPKMHRTTTTLVPTRCEADLNGDTFVDEQDMAQLMRHEGTCVACEEDLNNDGLVDYADAQIIDEQWGPCRPEGDVFGGDHSADCLTGADSYSDEASDSKKRTREDVNGDGIVDMVDILAVAAHLGQEPTGDKAFSDVNDDGRIDEYDIRAIAEYVILSDNIGG